MGKVEWYELENIINNEKRREKAELHIFGLNFEARINQLWQAYDMLIPIEYPDHSSTVRTETNCPF